MAMKTEIRIEGEENETANKGLMKEINLKCQRRSRCPGLWTTQLGLPVPRQCRQERREQQEGRESED
jgi:hypothetical protein